MSTRSSTLRIKKLQRLARSVEIDLWALDEVHFQQHGSRCRMWVPPEVRDPVLWHHPTRRSVGYFGAVRLRDGRFLYRQERERFNAQSFFDFLCQLRRITARTDRKAVLIVDNVRYHHASFHKEWRDYYADRFELDFLPAYSPDLNPIERVWKLTRRLCLHNRYFADLEQVVEAAEGQFDRWTRGNDTLRRLCAIT
jgi:transposase